MLCGNKLPWVDSCKHLGNTISIVKGKDIRANDIKIKRAVFIKKTNEIKARICLLGVQTSLITDSAYERC